jgi:MYXO-CTERM domain-containing protein
MRRLLVPALVVLASGCAGNGCTALEPLPNGFPSAARHENAAQIRLTESAVDFLEANAGDTIRSLVPGGLTFEIPPDCDSTPEVCCSPPVGGCQMVIDMDERTDDPPRLELTPDGNETIDLVIRARVSTPNPIPISQFGASCTISIDTTRSGLPSLTLTGDMAFPQDLTAGTTRLELQNLAIEDLENEDMVIGGGTLCELLDFDFLKTLILEILKSQITSRVQSTIDGFTCKTCTTSAQCAPFASCNTTDGICEIDDGDETRCLQELGVSGRLRASSVLGGFSTGQTGAMDLYDVAGGYGRTNAGGASLGVLGGARAQDGVHDACVPLRTAPTVAAAESPTFQGNLRASGEPFHIGFGMHRDYLNLAAWAAYDSGFLCANVGTGALPLLKSGAFSLIIRSLDDYLHGAEAPVVLALRPQQAPVLTLGANTFTEGAIAEPLMTIVMTDLELDLYVLVDGRYLRMMTVQTDITLPVGLDVNGSGQLVPVLGDLEGAFTNLSVTNSELLIEDPGEIADKLPAVLSIALPFLAGSLPTFDVPALGGLDVLLGPGDITSIDENMMLAIYADIALSSTKPAEPVETGARILSVTTPPAEVVGAPRYDRRQRAVVELAVEGGTEYQVRVDGGFWSPFYTSPTLALSREAFWIAGEHTVEVRARRAGEPASLDLTPVSLGFTIAFHGQGGGNDGCGCTVGGTASDPGAAWLLLLLVPLLFRRRLLAVALLVTTWGCGGDSGIVDMGPDVEPGPIGRDSDIAATGGRVVVSAYEERLGDLVVGEVDQDDLTVRYRVVDGAPAEPVVLDPGGYRGGVQAPGAHVGRWTSIVLTGGRVRVAYQDVDAGALKVAVEAGNGTYTTHVVDPGDGGQAGLYSSLTAGESDLGVAYLVTGLPHDDGSRWSELRWAQVLSTSPTRTDEWSVELIDEERISCAGLCDEGESCVTASNLCVTVDTTCEDCGSGTGCIAGTCQPISAGSDLADLPLGVGLFASAARLSDGRPVVAYYARAAGDLRLATRSAGGVWDTEDLDAGTDGDTGQWASIAVDEAGVVHVAYQDAIRDRLLHVSTDTQPAVIDDGLRDPDRPHPVGASAALVITGGELRVAYQDQALADVLWARQGTDGTWTHATLIGEVEGAGSFTSAAVDDAGLVWVSTYVYGREAYPPGKLRVTTLP